MGWVKKDNLRGSSGPKLSNIYSFYGFQTMTIPNNAFGTFTIVQGSQSSSNNRWVATTNRINILRDGCYLINIRFRADTANREIDFRIRDNTSGNTLSYSWTGETPIINMAWINYGGPLVLSAGASLSFEPRSRGGTSAMSNTSMYIEHFGETYLVE